MTSSLLIAMMIFGVVGGQDLDGAWGPWEADPDFSCCMYGPWERVKRFCNNPAPEGNGAKCTDASSSLVLYEEIWRSCSCECGGTEHFPACAVSPTVFCSNDSGAAPHCVCKHPLVIPPDQDLNLPFVCVDASTIEEEATTPKPIPRMASKEKTAMDIFTYIAIGWLLFWVLAVFLMYLILCSFTSLRLIHMSQELCLIVTYVFILVGAEETSPEWFCKLTSISTHYFFLACMIFFCLEGIQTYSLVTYVVAEKGYIRPILNLVCGYGIALLIAAVPVGVLWDKYGERYCWITINSTHAWAVLMPILFIAFLCLIIAEAQGQDSGEYKELEGMNETEYISARVSQGSIVYVMGICTASYVVGAAAVHLQNVVLFSIFNILNLICGPVVFFFHAVSHLNLRAIVHKVFFWIPGFNKDPNYVKPSQRVKAKKVSIV